MFLAAALFLTAGASAMPPATDLTVEYLTPEYAFLATEKPRFSWTLPWSELHVPRGTQQAAYRIAVRSASGATFWDSGRVNSSSNEGNLVEYAGQKLKPFAKYTWTVEYWLSNGQSSGEVASADFLMGPLSEADWHGAEYIGGEDAQAMRVPLPPVSSASEGEAVLLFLASPGGAVLTVNGRAVETAVR